MTARRAPHRFTWFHVFSILLLIMLVLPAGRAQAGAPAQGSDGGSWRSQGTHASVPAARPSGAPKAAPAGVAPPGTNLIQDPGFELYWPNPYWTEYDSQGVGVLCNTEDCGTWAGHYGPRTGAAWVWIGGYLEPSTSGIYQYVSFPGCGATLTLRFYLMMASDAGYGSDDLFGVFVDDTLVWYTSAAQMGTYGGSYHLVTLNLNAFADGLVHSVEFSGDMTGHNVSFNVDDVSLIGGTPGSCTYTISGNAGVASAVVKPSGLTGQDATADGSGNYSVTVPYGWSGRITPVLAGYGFQPTEYSYSGVTTNITGQNFTAHTSNATVSIAGQLHGEYYIESPGRVTPMFPVLNGPVDVTSGLAMFASERVHNSTGFVNEVMGVPDNQLTTEYWFPWYDNLTMQTWILVGNPSPTDTAHVHIFIAGEDMDPAGYDIAHGDKITPTYARLNGPVHIVSSIPVFASERVHTAQGFVQETMGYPNNRLTNKYWFPWYDNLTMQSWLLVGNPSDTLSAHVHIFIAGEDMNPDGYDIGPGDKITPTYGRLNGPVLVQSDNPVFASERVHNVTGFVQETMGVPDNKLTSEYWFPWYDNLSMQTWLLVGNPSDTLTATVHIYIAGEDMNPTGYSIGPGDRITPTYARLNGPVHITSSLPVFASERVHTAQGFVQETMGMPNDQLTTKYWFPWYDNLTMQSWILVGRP